MNTGERGWRSCRRRWDFRRPKLATTIRWRCELLTGRMRFLLTGDLESPMERLLLADGRALHADVSESGAPWVEDLDNARFSGGGGAVDGGDFGGV